MNTTSDHRHSPYRFDVTAPTGQKTYRYQSQTRRVSTGKPQLFPRGGLDGRTDQEDRFGDHTAEDPEAE